MSEGDVSLISDEDVLRRMWQQTEDFGRKKEIRSHMYRLREERLRNLYSPGSQPTLDGKGCEFSSSPGHLRSFADQSFQSMKSKEVRDAGSPPKDFEYRGQDLKELSNAGWNVESENRITDDGHTQIRAVQANIEGRYDVEGGKGQFAAIDQNKQSVTEYHDDNTSLKRKENSSHAAAHEQVMRHTDDGSHFSSTTSSSTSTSKFKQTSSTKHETVPYATNNKYDISQPTSEINDNVEEIKRSKINDYEQSLRKSDYDQAELVSRKVEYPDDNTKIVIETRCLPDGTRVTSTRREFRGPAVNTNYSEHQSQKIRKENKSFMTSSQKRSDVRQTSRMTDEFIDDQIHDIVDSQRIIDDKDFNKVYHTNEKIQTTDTKKIVHNQDSRNSHHVDHHTYNTVESNDEFDVLKTPINDDNASDITCTIINNNDTIRKQSANYSKVCKDEYKQTMKNTADTRTSNITDQHSITPTTDCDRYVPNEPQNKDNRAYVKKTNDIETYKISKDIEDINSKISTDKIVEEIIDKKVTSDQHQTTYQTDFIQNKISTEWSPTHQAWASTLRADTPPTTRPSTRASSPGSRTFKSSTSSLRSSVSPDKTVKKPGSRGTSPIKRTTTSPSRTTTQKNSHTHITNTVTKEVTNRYTSPERKQPHGSSPTRYSVSPDRKPQVDFRSKSNISPEKHHDRKTSPTNDLPSTIRRDTTPTRYNQSPEKHKQLTSDNPTILSYPNNSVRPSLSPERKPPTGLIRKSPEKKPQPPKISTPTLPRSVVPEVRPYRKSDNEELTKPTDFKEHSPPRSFNRDESKDVKGSDSSNAYSTRPNSDRKSTNKHDSTIVVNKTSEIKTTIKTNEDNYELVNQNISTHYHNVEDNKDLKKRIPTSDDINTLKSSFIQTPTKINSQSPTPPGARPTLRTTSRSPSPPKGSVTFTSTEEFDVKCLDEVDRTKQIHSTITNISATDVSKDNRNRLRSPKDNEITSTTSKNKTPDRETSPTKYTTYDNKQQRTEEIKDSITPMSSDSRDDKFTRREKSPKSFSESQESPNKFSTDRDGVSPSKSSSKYSHNSDFINTERKTEEINKKTKDRPRQLVTPSTSPTRKPAGRDNAPSTGQSSPTTSVSGFVYFSSPNTEKNVTNYDEDLYTENEKNEYTTKNIRETPSKLPCKPPLPRQGSPSKEALPRKSSLKKPTESIIQLPSPTEKPPTTFLISPTEPNVSEQKIVKKDQPIDKTISERSKPKSPIKQKPPLERRETYEERCRKILGMMDSSNEKSTESIVPQSDVQKHSPSISPCCSPELKEDLPFSDFSSKTIKKDIKSNITDFIKHEQREITKATKQKDNARPLSRDTSPTKLKDILVPQNENTENPTFTTDTDANFEETIKSQNINRKSNRMSLSPERKLRNPSLTKEVVEETKHSRTPSPTKNTRYINEKPKTKVIDHCTDENEFVLKNSIKQISSEIHRETPSLRPDKQIYACFPQNSSVINVIKNTFEESKQTYNISEKSSDIIHQTIKKSDEPHSKTPSPSKNYKATELIIRDKATTHKIPQVQPKALNQKQGEPIKSRTPSPSKSVLKTPGDHETVPKYLSEKPYDRKVKEKPKESIHSRTSSPTKNVTKITDCYTEEKNENTSRREIKQSDMLGKITPMNKSQRPERSRTPSPTKTMTKVIEYTTNVNEGEITTNISNHPSEVAQNNYPKQKLNEPTHSSTPLTNKSVVKDTNEYTIRHDNIEAPRILGKDSLISNPNEPIHSRTPSPTKSFTVTKRDTEEIDCLTSSIHQGISETTNDNISTTILKETSRSRTPSPTKPMAKEIKNSIANKPSDVPSPGKFSPTQKIKETNTYNTPLSTKTKQQTHSPRIPTQKSDKTSKLTYAKKPVKPTDLDTIESDARKTKFTEESEKFIVTEREQEIFVQQQKSLKNSPHERRHKSPTPPCNNRFNVEYSTTEESFETTANNSLHKLTDKNNCKQDKPRDQSIPSKLPSRNISPTKKTNNANPTRPEITPESPTKSRSMSPRKPMSPIGRPQSPQIPKGNVSKSKEPVGLNKIGVTSEINKITNTTKQNSFTKTSTNKNISKFSSANKPSETFSKSNVSKKESEIKITRTTNDINKKPSSQKTRSKPEIQVTAVTSKYTKQKTTKPKNQSHKEPQTKKIEKPKSATALNTSTDDEDVLVDVQQAKSSRENSPDRICPTPVNILDDSGTPRFPDEVKEPDDDFRRRTHHTIHETETIVDDIVEISEDDELFVKNSKRVDKLDESSLGVNNEVNPKDGTKHFKTTKNRIQTDLIDENSKSDEYLLSVSEKVNKFAKGPKDTKDCKSPSRRVVEEYDTDTVYQDNYTKLSVNDKANLFIQTAEKIKSPTTKVPQKAERPDLNDIDDSLKSDDCLLSVSDKVNKFVKTAEQFLTETNETEEKEKKIKEKHEIIMKSIVQESDNENNDLDVYNIEMQRPDRQNEKLVKQNEGNLKIVKKNTMFIPQKSELSTPSAKPIDRTPTVKITTLRSSEAVKKAKALFENIASTTHKLKDHTTKLTDIGVNKKTTRTISTIAHHPSVEESATDGESDVDISQSPTPKEYPTGTLTKQCYPNNEKLDNKRRSSPSRPTSSNSEVPRSGTPSHYNVEEFDTTKTVISRYPERSKSEIQKHSNTDADKPNKPHDYVPGYLRPTKTSQIREETKTVEENTISGRRGSGKFGIELRRTSTDRTSVSSEGRHSIDLHQPCVEDIFDVDLLEQMLEKVNGYEQRRRIRAQIRIAKKQSESSLVDTNTYTKTVRHMTPKNKSPERQAKPSPQRILSPDHAPNSKLSKPMSPDRFQPKETSKPMSNGHSKETIKKVTDKPSRLHSPEKNVSKSKTRSPVRNPSPEKKPTSISSTTSKSKTGRFNEYATAYMKKVGINESDKSKLTDKTKKVVEIEDHEISQNFKEFSTMKTESTSITKTLNERITSKDTFDEVNITGNRSSSPEKRRSPMRQPESPTDRLYRSPSPELKRPKTESLKKETTIKTAHNIEKKIQPKPAQEDKPSWVTNRNLKKLSSETRTFNNKKVENEKPKYRAPSPSKVISKPTDVITSSYGPGPLDADGRPLFGIKALRHGATNYQVKGTVIRQEYHSKNGGEPEGTVSVTAYSTEPQDLETLISVQGERPSRLHGLAAITTTKKFGGSTGTTIKEAHSKEERASLEQFTHSDRKVTHVDSRALDATELRSAECPRPLEPEQSTKVSDRRQKGVTHRVEDVTHKMEERKQKKGQPARQSSVKSLTEKFIKNATESSRAERSSYPKAGLILRTTTRGSISSDSSNHAGLCRTDSEHSLASADDETVVTTVEEGDGRRVTTTTTTRHHQHHAHGHGHGHIQESFLDSNTKVTGVQDILTRMKNADIVITEGDSSEDAEARALLNKFLGASVLMAGVQAHVERAPPAPRAAAETVRSGGGRVSSERSVREFDLDQCWDERVLRKLLEECADYEQRRRLRARIRTLMAEQEACATAVTDAVAGAAETSEPASADETREEEEVTVTSSVRRNSSEKTVSSSTTTKTSKVFESAGRPAARAASKPVSPFAKFRQLEKQNSTNTPNSPSSPGSPGSPQSPGSPAPYFKFTDPALQASAVTIKERLLQWCRDKTRDYENVKLENFSTSWADGLAFCALVHHFLPTAFDYSALTPDRRRHNFTLAFKVADEKAGIYPLLDVDDMVAMRKPDWKCVFTYVQSIHRRFKDQN